jgi:hypothetical protein
MQPDWENACDVNRADVRLDPVPRQFGLALSGGGFRATLFHLGVVRFLYEAGLLPRVRFISGVSGGAILAAHIGLNWKRYTGNAEAFATAAAEVVAFTQIDLRNRIIRRWLVGWLLLVPRLWLNWSRTALLQREYHRLYGNATVDQLPSVYKGSEPRVVLQSASLTTGLPCTFGRSGFMEYLEEAGGRGLNLPSDFENDVGGKPEVAFAVTASSAFPPLFPSVRVTDEILACKRKLEQAHELTDGGIFDNFGIDRPLRFYQSNPRDPNDQLDAFLLSDGEGNFNLDERSRPFKFALLRNIRATELLMKRLSTLTWKHLSSQRSHEFVAVSIAHHSSGDLSKETHEAVKAMRTDLDRFSDLEIECLIDQGYASARTELVRRRWVNRVAGSARWCPVPRSTLDGRAKSLALAKSARRRWLPLVTAFADGYTWALLAVLAVIILLIVR